MGVLSIENSDSKSGKVIAIPWNNGGRWWPLNHWILPIVGQSHFHSQCVWFSLWENVQNTSKLMREMEFYKSPTHFPAGPILGRNSIMFLAAGWETSTSEHQKTNSEVCETNCWGNGFNLETVTLLYPVGLVGTFCALLFPTRSGTFFDRTCTAFPHVFPTAQSLLPLYIAARHVLVGLSLKRLRLNAVLLAVLLSIPLA